MTLADVTLAYDFLRQKEERYREARQRPYTLANEIGVLVKDRPSIQFAKDEVDRAFALFVQDLTSYIRES